MLFTFKQVTDETLDRIYKENMHEIFSVYIEGTTKFIEKYHPDLDSKINEAFSYLCDNIWERCISGDATIEEFKKALENYKNLYLQGIELFKKKEKSRTSTEPQKNL